MTNPVAIVSQLVGRSTRDVIDAFVDPRKITQFWLEKVSGPLAAGATVHWWFMVPGATETVTVTEITPERICFGWSSGIRVELEFQDHGAGTTIISVTAGFSGDATFAEVVAVTEGFSIVLCDLKLFLETGHSANLVRDKARLIAESSPPVTQMPPGNSEGSMQ